MDCHQRRTARRVDGDRGALQPQPIADPARCRGIRRPDRHIGLDLGVRQLVGCHSQVVVGGQTDEHAGVGVGQIRWRGARMLHRAPRRLQQEPMLRVHQPDLAGRHAEERRVEARHVIDEPRATGHDLAGHTGFGVEEFVDVPAILGHLRYRVAALAQHVPEFVGIRGAGETRRVADDGETWGRLDRTFGRYHAVVLLASAVPLLREPRARKSTPTNHYCTRSPSCASARCGSIRRRATATVAEGMLISRQVLPDRIRPIREDSVLRIGKITVGALDEWLVNRAR